MRGRYCYYVCVVRVCAALAPCCIVSIFYKGFTSLFPPPRLARDLARLPVTLDTIKAGLLFPALVRCLYFLAVWKAEQAYIFRSDRLGDLFKVCRV